MKRTVDKKYIEMMFDRLRDLNAEAISQLNKEHDDVYERGTDMSRLIDAVVMTYVG